jgi:hypothetical protein
MHSAGRDLFITMKQMNSLLESMYDCNKDHVGNPGMKAIGSVLVKASRVLDRIEPKRKASHAA